MPLRIKNTKNQDRIEESELDEQTKVEQEEDLVGKKKSRTCFSMIQSIFSYLFFLGLSYVLSQYIHIPLEISFLLYFLFGAIAVLIRIQPKRLKLLKNTPLLRRHFGMMYKVNTKISESFEKGAFKGSLKFSAGILYLIGYFTVFNLIIITFKYILSFFIEISNPFQFIEAFFCLLGAGMIAYGKWMVIFAKIQAESRRSLHSEQKNRRLKYFGKQISFGVGLWIIFSSYFNWVGGLIVFLVISPFFSQFILPFLIGVGFFFILMVISLLLLLIFKL